MIIHYIIVNNHHQLYSSWRWESLRQNFSLSLSLPESAWSMPRVPILHVQRPPNRPGISDSLKISHVTCFPTLLHFLVKFGDAPPPPPPPLPPEKKKVHPASSGVFTESHQCFGKKLSPDRPKAFQRKVAACWAWLTWLRLNPQSGNTAAMLGILSKMKWK